MDENNNKFGDFQEVKDKEDNQEHKQQFSTRVRMPRDTQVIGLIIQRLGGNRMEVKATDGKVRNCRVPGRYRRRLWLRPRDFILIVPWEYDDNKADIIYKYNSSEVNQLRKREIIKSLKDEF